MRYLNLSGRELKLFRRQVRDVSIESSPLAALFLTSVGRADLDELGFGRNGLGNVRLDLGVVADGVDAIALPHVGKQEPVVPRPLRSLHATPRRWDKLCVPLVEQSQFQDEQDGVRPLPCNFEDIANAVIVKTAHGVEVGRQGIAAPCLQLCDKLLNVGGDDRGGYLCDDTDTAPTSNLKSSCRS